MDKELTIYIFTPQGRYLRTNADYLGVVSTAGALGILPNHSPLITKIEISELVIKNGGNTMRFAVSGGLMNVKENSEVTLLLNAIERSDEIDINRAEAAKERAEKRLDEDDDIDVARAKGALSRALNRIAIYNKK